MLFICMWIIAYWALCEECCNLLLHLAAAVAAAVAPAGYENMQVANPVQTQWDPLFAMC